MRGKSWPLRPGVASCDRERLRLFGGSGTRRRAVTNHLIWLEPDGRFSPLAAGIVASIWKSQADQSLSSATVRHGGGKRNHLECILRAKCHDSLTNSFST